MKFFKSTHDYSYEWNLVSAAQWQKYPNENCPHVSHVDVLNRQIDPETGIMTTERLITVNQNIPTIIRKVKMILSFVFVLVELKKNKLIDSWFRFNSIR